MAGAGRPGEGVGSAIIYQDSMHPFALKLDTRVTKVGDGEGHSASGSL